MQQHTHGLMLADELEVAPGPPVTPALAGMAEGVVESMMHAWYQAGYHTGYWAGLQAAKHG